MTKFEKISKEQFEKDFGQENRTSYEDIKLPRRATKHSAGYDFFLPYDLILYPGETKKIPTGVRVYMPENKFLLITPRSGLGFKYRFQLDNTVGIIDSDYVESENEGHIWVKVTNDSKSGKVVAICKGDAFVQGIFINYGLTDDDFCENIRNGGFGSTDGLTSSL